MLKENVANNGGYDKDLTMNSMIENIKNDHPAIGSTDGLEKNSSPAVPGASSDGPAVLSIVSRLATQADASSLAGHTFGLTQDSFDSVLMKAGYRPPPGTSPFQVWAVACHNGSSLCQQGLKAMDAAKIRAVKLDLQGKAIFPALPAGTYYLFGVTRSDSGHLVWSIRVSLTWSEFTDSRPEQRDPDLVKVGLQKGGWLTADLQAEGKHPR